MLGLCNQSQTSDIYNKGSRDQMKYAPFIARFVGSLLLFNSAGTFLMLAVKPEDYYSVSLSIVIALIQLYFGLHCVIIYARQSSEWRGIFGNTEGKIVTIGTALLIISIILWAIRIRLNIYI